MKKSLLANLSFPYCEWLKERYDFDVRARSKKIESLLLRSLSKSSTLQILDVGSGLGANTHYYCEILPSDQEWTLLEKDKFLAMACLQDLFDWANSRGWLCRLSPGNLKICFNRKRISIRIVQGSIFEMKGKIAFSQLHLAMANGVFDLLSKDQFSALAKELACYRVPILATLNYKSMHFEPEREEDEKFIAQYECHMTRPQIFGKAMGPDCSLQIVEILKSLDYIVSSGKSTWIITSKDKAMFLHIFRFMQLAISELNNNEEELRKFNQWLLSKQTLLERNQLELIVFHTDIFAKF